MKQAGNLLQADLNDATKLVDNYGSETTKNNWASEFKEYNENLFELRSIMSSAISKIKDKEAQGHSDNWNNHYQYSSSIKTNLNKLQVIGKISLPENEISKWNELWTKINQYYYKIENESQACEIKLKMIEEYTPEEVDEISDTILKHIPLKYTTDEANKYNDEYMKAYEEIKKEASQKKNLWDKFLDILAGGSQQTPAQRVMMQRWVDGEKGELH